jgi:hypothetical protein
MVMRHDDLISHIERAYCGKATANPVLTMFTQYELLAAPNTPDTRRKNGKNLANRDVKMTNFPPCDYDSSIGWTNP